MTGKRITEMTDEELQMEILRLQETRPPASPSPKRPKRLDAQPKRRKSLLDQLEE